MIRVRRIQDPPTRGEGLRILVDRLWPRGMAREDLALDAWVKEAAPSGALRRWFRHEPQRWETFRRRYRAELDAHPDVLQGLLAAARHRSVTLLYAAADREHNNAVALKEVLEERLRRRVARRQERPAVPPASAGSARRPAHPGKRTSNRVPARHPGR